MLCWVWLFATSWAVASRILFPWGFSSKITEVGCHFLFQGVFPTQWSNPCLLCLLHWQVGFYCEPHLERPVYKEQVTVTCLGCQFLECHNYRDLGTRKAIFPLAMRKQLAMRSMYGQVVKRADLQNKTVLARFGRSAEAKSMNLLCGWSVMLSKGGDDSRAYTMDLQRNPQRKKKRAKEDDMECLGLLL